ncbi:zyg-11 -like protein, partial [Brachionus plicatilis]
DPMNNGFSQQPPTLYLTCIEFLCKNINLFCALSQSDPVIYSKKNVNYQFKDASIRFNRTISEDLLKHLSDTDKLTNSTLSLFGTQQTSLRKCHIKNALLSKERLKTVLKNHKISELSVNNLLCDSQSSTITINDIIDSLNDWSLINLSNLDISRNKSVFNSILVNLNNLKNLTKLNVSFTCFNNLYLDIVCQDLLNLEYLDMSATKVSDLRPLINLKDKIKHLYMYNMRASLDNDIIDVITKLNQLHTLDLSCDVSTKIFSDMTMSLFDVNDLLDALQMNHLPQLKYLDISGKSKVKQESLMSFLNSYPSLKFLGLALTNANSFEFSLPSMIVTGESTESQILSTLQSYKNRETYLQKALYNLFIITRNQRETSSEILQNINDVMLSKIKSQSIQLAATTCVYNLTKQNMYQKAPSMLLTKIINTIIRVMLSFPNTLVIFNKFECIKATLECLSSFKDQTTISSSIAICAQLCLNADLNLRKQFQKITEQKYLRSLLNTILIHMRRFGHIHHDESVTHSSLDIIFYLSEDNFDWCRSFITLNGLNVYQELIEVFENDSNTLFKILCMMYKLSEIAEIRSILFSHPISRGIKRLIEYEDLNISFLSMGFVANFLGHMTYSHWDWNFIKFDEMKYALKPRIDFIKLNWKNSLNLMPEYKQLSLDYLLRLTHMHDEPFTQIWSIWAINVFFSIESRMNENKLCTKNILLKLANESRTSPMIKKFCLDLINLN